MFDYGQFIGIPFKSCGRDTEGLDCWGLVKLVYKNQLGIELPEYYIDAYDTGSVVEAMGARPGWSDVSTPETYDVALIALSKHTEVVNHVGIYCAFSRVLHITSSTFSICTRVDRDPWKSRVLGYVRWGKA